VPESNQIGPSRPRGPAIDIISGKQGSIRAIIGHSADRRGIYMKDPASPWWQTLTWQMAAYLNLHFRIDCFDF
jgi:hypothetical protein